MILSFGFCIGKVKNPSNTSKNLSLLPYFILSFLTISYLDQKQKEKLMTEIIILLLVFFVASGHALSCWQILYSRPCVNSQDSSHSSCVMSCSSLIGWK